MKRTNVILISCVIVLILAISLSIGIGKINQNTVPTQPLDPVSQYELATEHLRAADLLSYYIATTQTIYWNDQAFTSYSQQRLSIQDPEKDTMRSSTVESLRFGSYTVDLLEYYQNGNGYLTVDDKTFTSPATAENFKKRYAPSVCFDPSLYSTITSAPINNRTGIFFEDPSGAESWALPNDAVFTDASGYAIIGSDGNLEESVYTVSCSLGSADITISTKIIMTGHSNVLLPDTKEAIKIDCFDAPRMLEQACGYLLQAQNLRSNAKVSIDCQTFSITRTQISDLTLSGFGENLYAQLDVHINQLNQSRGGEVTQIQQTERFENGTYSVSVNGAAATKNENIDAAAMRSYCQEVLVQDILLPRHIAGVTTDESDSTITLTFLASDDLAEAICSNVCNNLYSDPALLHALSSDHSTQSVQCILTLDKHTGIPISFTSQYKAHHTIEDISYQLESKTEQTYQYMK